MAYIVITFEHLKTVDKEGPSMNNISVFPKGADRKIFFRYIFCKDFMSKKMPK